MVRLIGYARPYVGIVLLAMGFAVLYSAARTGRVVLIKPMLDHVVWVEERAPGPAEISLAPPAPDRLLEALHPDRWRDAALEPGAAPEPGAAQTLTLGERLWALLVIGLAIVLLMPVAHFAKDYLVEFAMGRVLIDVQQDVCRKLLALPLSYHQDLRRGDALTRTIDDARRAHVSLRLLFADIVQEMISVGVAISLMLALSWQLTLMTLAVAPPLVGVVALFGRRIRKSARRRQESLGDVTQRLVDILAGIKVIQAFRAERYEETAFGRQNERLFRRGMKVVKNRVLSRSVVEGIQNALGVGIVGAGVVLVVRGQWGLTGGDLAAFMAITFSMQRTTKALTKGWTELQDSMSSVQRFYELVDTEAALPEAPDAVEIDGLHQGIRLEGVSFSYGREPVLRDVRLDVRAGEVVAIVGRTGAGKTTLADLLLRFHDPDEGRILLDGVDLRRIARDSLLAQIAVVTQESFLFEGTIRDNICYARPGATEAELMAAARAAHVDEFADHLPDGYDTQVGEGGTKLSGGQRQRITIARALIKNPAILIFDEATSSLDTKSERLVQDAIDALLRDRTVFVIAHRLSTIRHADKIVVLENGTISQLGTHEELSQRPGLYRELLGLQQTAQ